jgi:hypothetical protein
VAAEVLGMAVLLVLAGVTGPIAQGLSQRIDNRALADLVRFDPDTACIGGADTLTGWYRATGQPRLWLEADFPSRGDSLQVCRVSSTAPTMSLFEGHNNSYLLDEMTLAAMYKCGILTGFADLEAVANATEHGFQEGLPYKISYWLFGDNITVVENISVRLSNTHVVQGSFISRTWTSGQPARPQHSARLENGLGAGVSGGAWHWSPRRTSHSAREVSLGLVS